MNLNSCKFSYKKSIFKDKIFDFYYFMPSNPMEVWESFQKCNKVIE